jgi:hypothetical protein
MPKYVARTGIWPAGICTCEWLVTIAKIILDPGNKTVDLSN